MNIPNNWPKTASFNFCGIHAFEGKFVDDHYEGIVSEPFREAFRDKRLKAFPAHEVECVLDGNDEVAGYDIKNAKFNLLIEPKAVN